MDLILYTADFLTPEQLIKLYSCVVEIGSYSCLLVNIASSIEMKLMDKEKFHSKHTQLIGKIITKAYSIRGSECSESAKRLVLENNSEISIDSEKNRTNKKVDTTKGQNTRRLPIAESKTNKAVKTMIESNDVELLCANKRSRNNICFDKVEVKTCGGKRKLSLGKTNGKYDKDRKSKMESTITESHSPKVAIAVLKAADENAATTAVSKNFGIESSNTISCPLPLSDDSEINLKDPQPSTSDYINIILLQNSNDPEVSYLEVPFKETDASSSFVAV